MQIARPRLKSPRFTFHRLWPGHSCWCPWPWRGKAVGWIAFSINVLCTRSGSMNSVCAKARYLSVEEKSAESKGAGCYDDYDGLWFNWSLGMSGFRPVTSLLACSLDWHIWVKCSWTKLLLSLPALISLQPCRPWGTAISPCKNLPFFTEMSHNHELVVCNLLYSRKTHWILQGNDSIFYQSL